MGQGVTQYRVVIIKIQVLMAKYKYWSQYIVYTAQSKCCPDFIVGWQLYCYNLHTI